MGFYYRKSISRGPVRINFSKSGVGASYGVRGARLSVGPRGVWLNAGANGLFFRKKLGNSLPFLFIFFLAYIAVLVAVYLIVGLAHLARGRRIGSHLRPTMPNNGGTDGPKEPFDFDFRIDDSPPVDDKIGGFADSDFVGAYGVEEDPIAEEWIKACSVINAPATASWEEIHSAFRRQVKLYHPDAVCRLDAVSKENARKRYADVMSAMAKLEALRSR